MPSVIFCFQLFFIAIEQIRNRVLDQKQLLHLGLTNNLIGCPVFPTEPTTFLYLKFHVVITVSPDQSVDLSLKSSGKPQSSTA